MSESRGRFARFTDAVRDGARTVQQKARDVAAEFGTDDARERELVAPLLPGEQLRVVGLASVQPHELNELGKQFTDEMSKNLAEAVDPKVLFGLLHIANPVMWVEAVISPVRIAAGILLLPAGAGVLAATAGTSGSGSGEDLEVSVPGAPPRPRIALTPEQEAFRALFRLSAYRPLADQLAEISYRWRYAFSGDLASTAGSMLLFLAKYTGTPIAVTETHLHLLRMGRRPDEGKPDRREPRLLWHVPLSAIARVETHHGGARLMSFPFTIHFTDGSWIRLVNPTLRDDHQRLLAALGPLVR